VHLFIIGRIAPTPSNYMNETEIKEQVKAFWNDSACGTYITDKDKYTLEYFEDIELDRYSKQPEIKPFAQFNKFKGKKLLEVGVGAGTDFLQWVRGGAEAYGVDLTEEAIAHVEHRLGLYGLTAKEFRVADCENLPYSDNFFDVVYSWGVIHHTPDTPKAMREIYRVLKPGGNAKVMIYHRHSVLTYLFWVKHALLKGKPFLSLSKVLFDNMESIGTKAYTKGEAKDMLKGLNYDNLNIRPVLTYYDKLERFNPAMQYVAKILAKFLGGDKAGWFLLIEFDKK